MPGGDRTGPAGAGSLTGRKAGFCAGFIYPGFMNFGFGRRLGYGINIWYKRLVWLSILIPGCAYLIYRNKQKYKKERL